MPGNWKTTRFQDEYMPSAGDMHPAARESDLIQALRDVTDVEKVRVVQEQAKVTFGSASMAPHPAASVDLSGMGPSSWWNTGKGDSAAGTASAATLSIMRQALHGAGATTAAGIVGGLAAGAMGGPAGMAVAGIGAVAQIGGMALHEALAPAVAQYSGRREGLLSTKYSTDESYTNEMMTRYGNLREAEANYSSAQTLWEATKRGGDTDSEKYRIHTKVMQERAAAVRAQEQNIFNLESVRGGTKDRLESFFAPFGKAGMYPSRDMMDQLAPLFKMQSDAMRHISLDAEATASKFAKQPGNEARQIGK